MATDDTHDRPFEDEGSWVLNAGLAGDGGADEYAVRGGFDE